jgi:hypothetical protein
MEGGDGQALGTWTIRGRVMNYAQRLLLIAFLVGVGVVLAFVFLHWGEGAFSNLAGNRIATLVLREDKGSFFGSGYGLYTTQGVPGVLLGLIAPLCLFAVAAFVALGIKARQ